MSQAGEWARAPTSLRYYIFLDIPVAYQLSPLSNIPSGKMGESFSNVFRGIPELLRSLLIIEELSCLVVKNMASGIISLCSNPSALSSICSEILVGILTFCASVSLKEDHNRIYLKRLLGGSSELQHVKHLERCLMPSKHISVCNNFLHFPRIRVWLCLPIKNQHGRNQKGWRIQVPKSVPEDIFVATDFLTGLLEFVRTTCVGSDSQRDCDPVKGTKKIAINMASPATFTAF